MARTAERRLQPYRRLRIACIEMNLEVGKAFNKLMMAVDRQARMQARWYLRNDVLHLRCRGKWLAQVYAV